MPKMRPPATEGVLKPAPSFFAVQASGGPSVGHSWSSPVSREIALRSGPCHCGQSAAPAENVNRRNIAAANVNAVDFMVEFLGYVSSLYKDSLRQCLE